MKSYKLMYKADAFVSRSTNLQTTKQSICLAWWKVITVKHTHKREEEKKTKKIRYIFNYAPNTEPNLITFQEHSTNQDKYVAMKCVSQWTASDLRWREVELVFIVFFSRWPIANHLYVKLEFYSLDLFHAYFHSVNYILSGISLVPF